MSQLSSTTRNRNKNAATKALIAAAIPLLVVEAALGLLSGSYPGFAAGSPEDPQVRVCFECQTVILTLELLGEFTAELGLGCGARSTLCQGCIERGK